MPKQQDQGSKTGLERMWAIDAAITLFSMGFLMLPVHPIPWRYSTAYKILENVSVDTLCPRDPCRCQVDACYQLRRSSGSVDPAKDVRTHPPMVLLVIAQKIKLTFFFVWRPFYIMSEALFPSLMVGRLFGLSWCPQDGGRVIITLQAAVRDRGGDLPSLLSFRSAGGGTWAVAGCRGWLNKACSLQSIIRTIGPDRIEHRPSMIFESVMCPWGIWIEVYATCPLGGTDRVDPDSGVCHVSLGGPYRESKPTLVY